MCGIAGIIELSEQIYPNLQHHLQVMNMLLQHRGPDGNGVWMHPRKKLGLAHNRLSIIDLNTGNQPMTDEHGNWIVFNGELYNYRELRSQLGEHLFRTTSDTEVILRAYLIWGENCLNLFSGMFAFAIWNEKENTLFCARDRFGIKPFYYTLQNNSLYFASEAKALLPFLPTIETDPNGLLDYLTFQFTLNQKTLFKGIETLSPAHCLKIHSANISVHKYWDIYYNIDFEHTETYYIQQLRYLFDNSIDLHLRSDVPVGAYVSGGIDSGAIAGLSAMKSDPGAFIGFNGKFAAYGNAYDESQYAQDIGQMHGFEVLQADINSTDFINHISKVIYHLDFPVAGPGSFPQYMVSALAAKHRKVVLGGQGGDEIFGGYVRYLIAYFEQCINGAIDGTLNNGNFVVTYESIIPNLKHLYNYKPLIRKFFASGMFEPLDKRYFELINRSGDLDKEIDFAAFDSNYVPYDSFRQLFYGNNVKKESYFDSMTHFDFKTLLPALLHVEDRMSMAHGLESRVPLLDHKLIEMAATIPADIKFKNGTLKRIFMKSIHDVLPQSVLNRTDKMGFPVPLVEWLGTDLNEYVNDIFATQQNRNREYFKTAHIVESLKKEAKFGRKIWGLLSLELWYQQFHDNAAYYKKLIH